MSDSENPAIDSPKPKSGAPLTNQDWWPEQIDVSVLHAHSPQGQPPRRRLRLRQGIREARRRGPQGRRDLGDHHLAGLVARRLRQLRRPDDPAVLARRRHLPHLRRTRWRRPGHAALRTAQQLARQRQPRQGPPPAVAGQAEVRQQDLVGRPAGVRGQRRAGVGGLRDVRIRVRPSRLLGARRGPLRRGRRVARHRQALCRRRRFSAAARGALRRHHDGPDLRQSRRPRGQAGSAGRGHRHQRDVRPDGDERRGDRGADRRRPHPRQDPRRGSGRWHGPRA